MKWIAAFFMVVNVAVYLWLDGHPSLTEHETLQSSPDVNRQVMVLLRETKVQGNIASAEMTTPLGTPDPSIVELLTGSGDKSEETVEDVAGGLDVQEGQDDTVSLETASLTCFRIGPFREEETWQAAVTWMNQNRVAFRHVVSEQRGLQAVRLYLGPFSASEEVDVATKDLEQKQIDYYIYRLDNGDIQMSLGYFTQAELAERYLKHLWKIQVKAKSQTETRTLGPYNWMETETGERDTVLLSEHDWLAVEIKLSDVGC